MGSQNIQAKLWGQRAADWADYQEPTCIAGYKHALQLLQLQPGVALLDIGCGAGFFCKMAHDAGATVTGFDATAALIEEAGKRVPGVTFLTGDMEELPFGNDSFEVVCGFNSFQYAGDTKHALAEAKRVLKPGGKLVAMVWGNKAECEAAAYIAAMGKLLPAPPPGAGGPFMLSENSLLQNLLLQTGFTISDDTDVSAVWDYANVETAMKGLLSAGPAARAIDHAGFDTVYQTVLASLQPFIQPAGNVVYHNKFRVVTAVK